MSGAQALVTGDVRHHSARDAEAAGFCLVDAGHASTEAVAIECLAGLLRRWASEAATGLRIEAFREPEPFSWVTKG
jgi:putative NIF3 family GTP cyclohydrolase 1 type 2